MMMLKTVVSCLLVLPILVFFSKAYNDTRACIKVLEINVVIGCDEFIGLYGESQRILYAVEPHKSQ
jgi:hypothetical protein